MSFIYDKNKDKKCIPVAYEVFKDNKNKKKKKRLLYHTYDDELGEKSIVLDPKISIFSPLLYKPIGEDQRVAPFIFGMSGSGKSTFLATLLNNMQKFDPKRVHYLITHKNRPDKSLSKVENLEKVDLESLFDVDFEDAFEDTNVLFDDHLKTKDAELKNTIHNIHEELLERSRDINCNVYSIFHNPKQRNDTTSAAFETTAVISFPQGNRAATLRFYKDKFDFNNKQLEYVRKLKADGRYTYCLFNQSPQYILSNDRIIMLDEI